MMMMIVAVVVIRMEENECGYHKDHELRRNQRAAYVMQKEIKTPADAFQTRILATCWSRRDK